MDPRRILSMITAHTKVHYLDPAFIWEAIGGLLNKDCVPQESWFVVSICEVSLHSTLIKMDEILTPSWRWVAWQARKKKKGFSSSTSIKGRVL
jgi:hypothetical protein